MNTRRIALLSSLAVLALAACGKDVLPPPAPAIDPIASPTSLSTITISGAAQYASKVKITGVTVVSPTGDIVADPFTARWSAVVVLLHNAKNTISVTATDSGNRVSPATAVDVQQSDNFAAAIQNLLVNGVPCAPGGTPPACSASSGDVIDFDLVANSTVGISEVQYTAFFATAGGTGTLRSQRVLVAPNSPLPYTQHFTFNVPGNSLLETVPIEGLSIDSQGNRFTSPELDLKVNSINAGGRTVTPLAVGRLVNAPNDVAVDAAGAVYIANDGNRNVLKLASGAASPVIFSNYNGRSRYLGLDGAGTLYVSDDTANLHRITSAGVVDTYLALTGGIFAEGMSIDAPTVAKGLVSVGTIVAGNTVTVGAKVYEFQAGATGCSVGNVCVDLNAANKTQALATAVQAQSAEANAVFDTGSGKAVIAAKSAGAAGNSIVFATNSPATITLSPNAGKLGEGHDENLFLGQRNAGDTNLYRFAENLAGLPAGTAANEGAFNVGTQQLGVAVRDLTTATSANLRDLFLYFIDDGATDTLRGFHAVDATAPAQVFAIRPGGGAALYDVVMLANGCTLISDQGAGKIYSVDTRTPTTANPTVATVASGMNAPRGMFVAGGDLYVADNGFNAVVKISPLATAACF